MTDDDLNAGSVLFNLSELVTELADQSLDDAAADVLSGVTLIERLLREREASITYAVASMTRKEIDALAERVVAQVEWSTALGDPRERAVAYAAEILAELEDKP